jgi:hypothetical protein
MPNDPTDMSLIAYRVQEMENKLESIGTLLAGKIEALTVKYDEFLQEHIANKVVLAGQAKEIDGLKAKVEELQKELFGVKLSMAERIAFGVGGGAGGAALVQIILMLLGH